MCDSFKGKARKSAWHYAKTSQLKKMLLPSARWAGRTGA